MNQTRCHAPTVQRASVATNAMSAFRTACLSAKRDRCAVTMAVVAIVAFVKSGRSVMRTVNAR